MRSGNHLLIVESILAWWLVFWLTVFGLLQCVSLWHDFGSLSRPVVIASLGLLVLLAGVIAYRTTRWQFRYLEARPSHWTVIALMLVVAALVASSTELVIYGG